ncbi:hypothetical protein D0864_06502 [Hortaea werneckii]|uniref:Uncharacterized protein n=1 Tax=Hortaea werneckii TaxID=91943 RepID=A0A3M7FL99_HORWE|nr:hypothetical protein D0864_06502 [Hortaea werneckii]
MFAGPRVVGPIPSFRPSSPDLLLFSKPTLLSTPSPFSPHYFGLPRREPRSSPKGQPHTHMNMVAMIHAVSVSMLAFVGISLATPVENDTIVSIALSPTPTSPFAYAKYDPALRTATMPAEATASIFCYDQCFAVGRHWTELAMQWMCDVFSGRTLELGVPLRGNWHYDPDSAKAQGNISMSFEVAGEGCTKSSVPNYAQCVSTLLLLVDK